MAAEFRPKAGWVALSWVAFIGNVVAFVATPSVALGLLVLILGGCAAGAVRARVTITAANQLCLRGLWRSACVAFDRVPRVNDRREVTGAFLAPVPRVLVVEDDLGNRVRVERFWWSRSTELVDAVGERVARSDRPATQ